MHLFYFISPRSCFSNMYPITDLSPSSVPFIYQGICVKGSSQLRKLPATNKKHLLLQWNSHGSSLFGPNSLALQYSTPSMLQHALEFSLHGCFISNLSFFLSTSYPCTKTPCVKLVFQPIQISSLWFAFIDLYTSPSWLYSSPMFQITMGCDFSHPPSYMYSMIGFGNTQS